MEFRIFTVDLKVEALDKGFWFEDPTKFDAVSSGKLVPRAQTFS